MFYICIAKHIINNYSMKKSLRLLLAVVFTAIFGMADVSATQWYGFALYTASGSLYGIHRHV